MPVLREIDPLDRPPVIGAEVRYDDVNRRIAGIVSAPTPKLWLVGFSIAFLFVMLFLGAVTYLFARGIGIWGVNVP
ncbi:MAG: hypothetical protein IT170_13110, partial [Bryobacterales bacterium]|nr:hypothetical protein [Bryobacterales bacterium]